jgi:hypothetical protein
MKPDNIHGICGPKCTNCDAYKATKNDDKDEQSLVASKWSKYTGSPITAEDVLCDGCRIQDGRKAKLWHSCKIRLCAKDKDIDICSDCGECPCKLIEAPFAREELKKLQLQRIAAQ